MNISLFRVNQRQRAIRALQSAHQRNEEEELNIWIVRGVAVIALAAIFIVSSFV